MRPSFGPFVAALLAGTALAQSPLYRILEEPIPGDWRPFAAMDVDVDGDVDLLAREGVLLNDGAGAFAPAATTNALLNELAAATIWTVADLNGDGADDVLFAGILPGGAAFKSTYLGAPGGLAPYATSMPAFTPSAIVAFDYDGDGLVDLGAVAPTTTFSPFGFGVLRNQGNGSFAYTPTALPAGGAVVVSYATAGDFDGDGDRDLFVLHPIGTASFWMDVGSGFAVSPGPVGLFPLPNQSAVADFDGDGADDVAFMGGPFAQWLDVFVRITAGAPLASVSPTTPAVGWAALDIDADGAAELAVSRSVTLAASPQTSMSVVNPAAPSAPPRLSWSDGPIAKLTADVDGDGDLDLIASRGGRSARIFYARGDGTLHESGGDLHAGVALLDALPLNSDPIVGDFDGDGDRDVARFVQAGCAGTPFSVLANDGQGRFPESSVTYFCASSSQYAQTAAADFDGDGRDDVVRAVPTTSNPSGNVLLLLYRMTATGPVSVFLGNETGAATPLRIFDADNDGDRDLLYASTNGTLAVYRDPASGGPRTAFAVGGFISEARTAELTGDGVADVLVAHATVAGGAYTAKIVNGATSVVTSLGVAAERVDAGDFDGDGDTDALVNGRVYVNNGTGTFTSGVLLAGYSTTPSGGFAPSEVFDADGDGDPDVLAEGKLWLGAAGATFSAPQPVPFVLPYATSIVGPRYRVADFDRDGDPDLLDPAGRLIANVSAHFAHGAPAAVGRTAELRAFGPPLQPADLLFATGAFAQNPIPVPGWGHLFLVPNTALFLGTFPLDATGEARIDVAVPNVPALVGFQLYWQAALPLAGRLTNVEKTVVLAL